MNPKSSNQNESPKNLSAKDLYDWLQKDSRRPVLIDVREESELAIAAFPFEVVHLPLSQAEQWVENLSDLIPKNLPIVVICHSGIRSWNFGIWLLEQGITKRVWNLVGGIDAWSTDVDQSVPRY